MNTLSRTMRPVFALKYFGLMLSAVMTLLVGGCENLKRMAGPEGRSAQHTGLFSGDRKPGDGEQATDAVIQSRHVAMLLPLSGDQGILGVSLRQAAEMALFDQESSKLKLHFIDTGGTPRGAVAAYKKALKLSPGIILGPVFATSVAAIKGHESAPPVPMISFSNNPGVAGQNVFAFGQSPMEQVQEILKFTRVKGFKKVAVLLPRDDYGAAVEEHIQDFKATNAPDINFVIITYSGAATALLKELAPLKALDPEAIFIPQGGAILERIISSILYQEIPTDAVQFLGTGQWDEPATLQNRTLEGAVIAAPEPKKWSSFRSRYRDIYGAPPLRIASLSYDLMSMLHALHRYYPGTPYALEALTQPRGFKGVDGAFRLTSHGLAERKLPLLQIRQQKLRVVKFADTKF